MAGGLVGDFGGGEAKAEHSKEKLQDLAGGLVEDFGGGEAKAEHRDSRSLSSNIFDMPDSGARAQKRAGERRKS